MPDTPAAITDPALTPNQLAAIVRRAFGEDAALREVSPVGGGTVNEVWRIAVEGEPDAILRVAPSYEAAESGPSWLTPDGLRREQAAIALLPRLAPILPRTIRFDGSREIVDRDWVMQTIVPGRPWSEVDAALDDATRTGLWRRMGTICRTIHNVHGPVFGPAHDPVCATWADLLQDDVQGLVEDARRFGIDPEPFVRLRSAVERHRAVLNRVTTPALIHSDLGPRHCFVEVDDAGMWRIVGLIDLEFARFADPLSESAIELFDLMPPDARFRNAFWKGYGLVETPLGSDIRAAIYSAIALGWVATDLARLDTRAELEDVVLQLVKRLDTFG
ncbi:MAG: aminoglycoside phosphotransferase family protein [Thermomicrobiales bacterium]